MKAKRLLAFFLSIALMLALATPAMATEAQTAAPQYGDTEGHWAERSIDRWSGCGVVRGSNGSFNPDSDTTAAELATILNSLLGYTEKTENTFADLEGSEWYADAVLKCAAAGVLKGDGRNINAETPMSRERTTVLLARALGIRPAEDADLSGFVDGNQAANWSAGYLKAMADAKIVQGVGGGKLDPTANINRASIMMVLDKAVSTYITEGGSYEAKDTGITLVKTGEAVTLTGSARDVLVAPGTAGGSVKLDGTSVTGTVTISAPGAKLTVAKGSTVEQVTICEDASDVKLEVDQGGLVSTVETTGDGAAITGNGTVKTVAVKGGTGTTVDTKGTTVKNEGTGDVMVSGKPIKPGESGKGESGSGGGDGNGNVEVPTSISVQVRVPDNAEMVVGDSRSADFIVYPESNQQRAVTWTSGNEEVATVDKWGRITAKAAGTVTITAVSKADSRARDSVTLKIVADEAALSAADKKGIVKYAAPVAELGSLQKFVDRYTKEEAPAADGIPTAITAYLGNPTKTAREPVKQGDYVTWSIGAAKDGAGADYTYGILREDSTEGISARDVKQYFMGDRYLPTVYAEKIGAIAGDGERGLWIATNAESGTAVTHIRMEELSYTEKAAQMSAQTQADSRHGFASGAKFEEGTWAGGDDDNDGLWTGMYGAGELMRYAVLRDDPNAADGEIKAARDAALRSIKAVLLLSNVSCRTGEVDTLIRPQNFDAKGYQPIALLKGKDPNLNTMLGSAADMTKRASEEDGMFDPFVPEDWGELTQENKAAGIFETRKRSLSGFICRTLAANGEAYHDGNRWQLGDNGTATCVLQDSKDGIPQYEWETTVDASAAIPAILMDVLPGGTEKSNIIYKADTSNDEVIGHLFIYKIAYDVLDDENAEEAELKQIIRDTMRRFAQHYVDNDYCLLDGTGQGTTWGKTGRDFFHNAMSWEDNSLHCIVNLCTFKLAAYVTGEQRWEDEYRMLALENPYRYADLAGKFWEHLQYVALADSEGDMDPNAPDEDLSAWVRSYRNDSDEEMAMLAYYLLFQMEKDPVLIEKYQKGIDAWWNSIQYTETSLWYYIYQLAYPNEAKFDANGNSLVDVAAWSLSRHPVDTIKWSATAPLKKSEMFHGEPYKNHYTYSEDESYRDDGYHPECIQPDDGQWGPSFERGADGSGVTHDPETGLIRTRIVAVPADERTIHRFNCATYQLFSDHNLNSREASTTFTLPYWLGRYHGMIQPSAN